MIANIIGASGSGKTRLVMYLMDTYPSNYQRAISYTSRNMRKGEINGIDYHFVENSFFQKNNDLLFKRDREDGLYAMRKSDLVCENNKVILTTFPAKGVLQLQDLGLFVKTFYLSVSVDECKRRMIGRGDDDASISKRILRDENESSLIATLSVLKDRPINILDGHQPIPTIGKTIHNYLTL